MPVQHPPTEWRRPVCPCGLTRCTELARSTLRGSTPRVLIETLRRSCATLRCIDPRRAPAARVMRRRLSAPGVPLPALRFTWPGRAPLGVAKLCVFPSRERGRQRGRPFVTRVTVSLSTPVSRRRSWGCQMWPFAGLLPQAGEARVSAPSDPHAVRRCVGRSILAARPAGPFEAVGRSCLIVLRASRAKRLRDEGQTNDARWVGRSRMYRFGFWVSLSLPSAIHVQRRSSFPPRVILPWAFASLRYDGCERRCGVHERTEPNGPSRSTGRPVAALPRPNPLMGFASVVSASRRVR